MFYNVVTILAALYLVFIGSIMNVTNGGIPAKVLYKMFPIVAGFLLVFPLLKTII